MIDEKREGEKVYDLAEMLTFLTWNLHLALFLLQFISFVSFYGGLCAHKQLAIDADPLKTFNDLGIVYIPPLEKQAYWPQHRPGLSERNLLPLDLKSTPAASKTSSAVKWAGGEWHTGELWSGGRVKYFVCVYPLPTLARSPDSI